MSGDVPAPGLVESWLITRDDYVIVARGNSTPVLVAETPRETAGLFRRLRLAGACSVLGEGIAVTIRHGYPPQIRYRVSSDGDLPPITAKPGDPVAIAFMDWYAVWRLFTRVRAARGA